MAIIFKYNTLMRGYKGKFDTSKPFKVVTNRELFEATQATDRLFPAHKPHGGEQQDHKKEEIVVPRIQVVPRLTQPKTFARVTPQYIRLPAYLNLPKTDTYQLSEVDHLFLLVLRKRYSSDRLAISEQFLERAIRQLQTRAGRDNVLPRSKGWIVSFIEKEQKQFLDEPTFEQFATLIYNYWKSRREELKFPIYRPLWRPAENEFNHMLAFKTRPKNSRNLRRANRVDETDIIQELHDEYQNAAMICERIQTREQLKLKQIQMQLLSLTQECKEFINVESIKEFLPEGNRSEQRQKVKNLRVSLEDYKKKRDNVEVDENEPAVPKQPVNQKESIAFFLSNVVYEAERLGVSHDTIFKSSEAFPLLKTASAYQSTQLLDDIPEIGQEKTQEKLQTTAFSLKRYGDLLVRSLSQDQVEYEVPPQNFFEGCHKRIASSFFGEDDNLGEFRDLRKVISASFKKFLQISNPAQ